MSKAKQLNQSKAKREPHARKKQHIHEHVAPQHIINLGYNRIHTYSLNIKTNAMVPRLAWLILAAIE